MNEITTEYLPETDKESSRIVALSEGHRLFCVCDNRLNMRENHIRAARHLCEDLDHRDHMMNNSRCNVRQGEFTSEPISHLKCQHILV